MAIERRWLVSRTALAVGLVEAIGAYTAQHAADDGHTARAKGYDLEHFRLFLAGRNVHAPCLLDVTTAALRAFIADRLESGEAASTVRRRMATLRHFCKAMSLMCTDFADASIDVRAPRVVEPEPRSLTEQETAAIREAAPLVGSSNFKRVRNDTLVETAFMLGLRCHELASLTEGQLDAELTTVRQVRGKGNKYVDMPIPLALRPLLSRYLTMRREELTAADNRYASLPEIRRGRYPLFLSLHGTRRGDPDTFRLNEKTIWRVFRSAGDIAGIEMSPHRARHTFVMLIYKASGGDIGITRRAARHESITTTARYLEPHKDAIRRAFDKLK